MELTITTLAEAPELVGAMWDMPNSWPEFMRHDPIGGLFYSNIEAYFADYVLIARDPDGEVVACAYSVPVSREEELPDNGWDAAIRSGLMTKIQGRTPNTVSAVEIAVRTDLQGSGLSPRMLVAMRDNAARHGFAELVAPVRPNGKTDIAQPMTDYAASVRDDGLPVDPWLRVHVRAGGRIDKVAPRSMVIPGTLAEWREWTGLPFDQTGPVLVPGALAPVLCDLDQQVAVYVEPNVWVVHQTGL